MRDQRIPLFCLTSLFALAALAVAEDDDVDDFDDFDPTEVDANHLGDEESLENGLVFIDGKLIPPPYRVVMSEDGEQVLVNDQEIPGAVPAQPPAGRGDRAWRPGRGRRGGGEWSPWGTPPPANMWAGRIRQHLDLNSTVVAFSGQRMRILDESRSYSLLKSLLELDTNSLAYEEAMRIPSGADATRIWHQWIHDFKPDATFRQHVEPIITEFEVAEAGNLAQAAAVRRLDAVAYPLTILGMILSVIAFGHLLMSLPNNDAMRRGSSDGEGVLSREVIRATMISVLLVAVLSSLDLVWTLLASQAGQMRELNPLASHFINDPVSLIAFKSAATLLGCGLLYALRNHSRAQMASWWMCLVCTMLTFRWLMFNSMFVS